jgi:hypothetical protein
LDEGNHKIVPHPPVDLKYYYRYYNNIIGFWPLDETCIVLILNMKSAEHENEIIIGNTAWMKKWKMINQLAVKKI